MDLPFEVVDLGPADHPTEGDVAPDFTRPLVDHEDWGDASLSAVASETAGPTVLLFHPMDGAFPTTYLWKEVRTRDWAADATVVGCSISTPYAHNRLIEDKDLTDDYRLFADPKAGVAETYGIAHDLDGMAGVTEHRPAAFVLAEDLTVKYAWAARQWPDFPDYDGIETVIR